jgi:hypothetical protein
MEQNNFNSWFAGLTDGEGSFIINRSIRKPHGAYKNTHVIFSTRFNMSLRDDDKATLELIKNTLGIGSIIHIPKEKYRYEHSFDNSRNQSMFRNKNMDDCLFLVRLFNTYPLRSKKAKDFHTWTEAVIEKSKDRFHQDKLMLNYLYEKLKYERKYHNGSFCSINDYVPDLPMDLLICKKTSHPKHKICPTCRKNVIQYCSKQCRSCQSKELKHTPDTKIKIGIASKIASKTREERIMQEVLESHSIAELCMMGIVQLKDLPGFGDKRALSLFNHLHRKPRMECLG